MSPIIWENKVEFLIPVDWNEAEFLDGGIEQIFSSISLPMLCVEKKNILEMLVICSDNTSNVFFDQMFKCVYPINLKFKLDTVIESH